MIDALGELKDEAAAAAVVKHLRRPRGEFAGHSTQALKAMGPVAEKPVLALLASAEPFHRKMAAQVLEEIGGRASLSPLEKARRDNEPFCAPDVERALTAVKDRLEDPEAK